MAVTIVHAESDNAQRWDGFVLAQPSAGFFHRFGWKTVIEESFAQPCHFLLAERNLAVTGVFPLVQVRSPIFGNRLVSTGWCVGGGVVAEDDESAAALYEAAAGLLAETDSRYIESRDPSRPQPGTLLQEGIYATFERRMETEEDACLKQIPRKQRAVVRKALKTTLIDQVDDTVDRFFDLYALTVRNHGTPVFAKRYFANLMRVFGSDCDVVTVSQDGKPLSSVLSFYHRDRVMPYYTGAVPEARRLGAADFMYWRLMRRGVDRGYSVFDFGRSKLGTGPYAFKKNWGFVPRPVVGEFLMKDGASLPNVNPNNPKYRLLINTWKRLPLPLANIIGPWVGRQVG